MIVILYGVAGSGKSMIGFSLAAELHWKFYDADEFHVPANIEKMRQGIALTDNDRIPWLKRLSELVQTLAGQGDNAVLACSALKESYRECLQLSDKVKLVYLKGEYALIEERLRKRKGHFMNPDLLRSQFEALEEPQGRALIVDVNLSPDEIMNVIRRELDLT